MRHPDSLTFSTLRAAGSARTPRFRNAQGRPSHTSTDGSCWSPAQWLQAVVGELGEFARVRHDYETGLLPWEQYRKLAAKELADVLAYLDLLAWRALDETEQRAADPAQADASQVLMQLVAGLGDYANTRKKRERGELSDSELQKATQPHLAEVEALLPLLQAENPNPTQKVRKAHPRGVDLGKAVRDKFNEVSLRVRVPVWIAGNSVLSAENADSADDGCTADAVLAALTTSRPGYRPSCLAEVAGLLKGTAHVFFDDQSFVDFFKRQDIDFVFDKASGVYLAGTACHHRDLLCALYRFHLGVSGNGRNSNDDAEAFIRTGMGMFKSRGGIRIYSAPQFEASAAQRLLQRDFAEVS